MMAGLEVGWPIGGMGVPPPSFRDHGRHDPLCSWESLPLTLDTASESFSTLGVILHASASRSWLRRGNSFNAPLCPFEAQAISILFWRQ